MRLTACLIVRDEAHHLPSCLQRVRPLVDDIVLVDTGSRDRSRAIARSFGAKVVPAPWEDDFSKARNVALDHAPGDWILYIDADEHLEGRRADLEPLDHPRCLAATVRFRAASHLGTYRETRLFRNRPDLRFRSRIHETIWPDLEVLLDADEGELGVCDWFIDHHGYEGDLTRKHKRNLGLLRRAVEETPSRVYLWHTLGECEMALGHRDRAEAAWRQGLAVLSKRAPRPGDTLIFADLMGILDGEERDELVREMARRHDGHPLADWWRARHALESGDPATARALAGRLLENGAEQRMGWSMACDPHLFGAFAQALLGNCDLVEERWADAAERFATALRDEPENLEYRTKQQWALSRVSAISGPVGD